MHKAIRLCKENVLGWKMEVVVLMLIGVLSEGCDDQTMFGTVVKLFLGFMASEVAQSRSLAVNRGVAPIYRYLKHCYRIEFDLDEHDSCHESHTPVPFNIITDDVAVNSFKYLNEGLKWIFQEGVHFDGQMSFRPDCAELFQTLTELLGFGLFEEILKIVKRLDAELNSPAYQRAMAEIWAGVCRGMTFHALNGIQAAQLVDELIKTISFASISSGTLWYESARFIVDSSKGHVLSLIFRLVADRVMATFNISDVSTVMLSIELQILTGHFRGCPCSDLVDSIFPIAHELMSNPLDSLRRSASDLMFVLVSIQPTNIQYLRWNQCESNVSYCKSLLILAEMMSQDPIRTQFWNWALDIVLSLTLMIGSDELEVQVEAKRILQVLAWTSFAPADIGKSILSQCLDFDDESRKRLPESSTKALLKFARTFYSRNSSILQSCNAQLVAQIMKSMAKDYLSPTVRDEFAEILGPIFHSNAEVCSLVCRGISSKLEVAAKDIKRLENIKERHILVLVASSLILSHPYDIPPWTPSLLTVLTRFIHDRHPISAVAKKIFSEFKRTHGARWEECRELFTEDQLEAMTELLVAPSYYV